VTEDEAHVAALKALLRRVRGNANGRLVARVGDEEEFVPRSVREARAAAAAPPVETSPPVDDRVDEGVGAPREAPTLAPGKASDVPPIAIDSSPPLDLDLLDPFEDDLLDAAARDDVLFDEESFEGPSRRLQVPPAAASRVIATAPPGAPIDHGFDDGESGDVAPRPDAGPRPIDPLAQTAQNPVPSFARRPPRTGAEDDAVRAVDAVEVVDVVDQAAGAMDADEAPSSSPRPVDPDVVADAGLDSEPPPESGPVASQRQIAPASVRSDDLDLDAPTATGESAGLARALEERLRVQEALVPEPVAAAPPAGAPRVVGRRPLAASTFLEVLDAALSAFEP
jgi:hypothetical protein